MCAACGGLPLNPRLLITHPNRLLPPAATTFAVGGAARAALTHHTYPPPPLLPPRCSYDTFVVGGAAWDWAFLQDYLHFFITGVTILASVSCAMPVLP